MLGKTCLSAISRIWLVVVNAIFLALGLGAVIAGILLPIPIPSTGHPTFNTINFKMASIGLLISGSFLILTSFFGCFGGMFKVGSFLKLYMITLTINILLILLGGIYGIIQIAGAADIWSSFQVSDWKALSDQDKVFIQKAMSCCGYSKGDGTAISGYTLGKDTTNICPKDNDLMGCYDAGNRLFGLLLYTLAFTTIMGVIISSISLVAANTAKKRKQVLKSGTAQYTKV